MESRMGAFLNTSTTLIMEQLREKKPLGFTMSHDAILDEFVNTGLQFALMTAVNMFQEKLPDIIAFCRQLKMKENHGTLFDLISSIFSPDPIALLVTTTPIRVEESRLTQECYEIAKQSQQAVSCLNATMNAISLEAKHLFQPSDANKQLLDAALEEKHRRCTLP